MRVCVDKNCSVLRFINTILHKLRLSYYVGMQFSVPLSVQYVVVVQSICLAQAHPAPQRLRSPFSLRLWFYQAGVGGTRCLLRLSPDRQPPAMVAAFQVSQAPAPLVPPAQLLDFRQGRYIGKIGRKCVRHTISGRADARIDRYSSQSGSVGVDEAESLCDGDFRPLRHRHCVLPLKAQQARLYR